MFRGSKIVVLLIAALLVFIFLAMFTDGGTGGLVQEFEVRDVSMAGLIEPGEDVKVDFEYFKTQDIKRGDLVLFQYGGNENLLLKKVFGIPRDIIDLQIGPDGARLFINGNVAVNSDGDEYLFPSDKTDLLTQYIVDYNNRIPADAYLLLGNLRGGSTDSTVFGLVSKGDILGKVIE